jgi:mRNA interferase MazF
MERFIKGDVIVVPFPFSDLTQTKRRPALVISELEGNDLILCQITSRSVRDKYTIMLNDKDFVSGSLKQPSNVRPNRIFTADNNIVLYRIGNLKTDKLKEIIERIIEIIRK